MKKTKFLKLVILTMSQENDYDYKEDDDEWMAVYDQGRFKKYCGGHTHLKAFKDYYYYQCWGGGDEGGYITNDKKTYRVSRSWFQPFTVERVEGLIELDQTQGFSQIRILPKQVR